jgi:hypothetical protein
VDAVDAVPRPKLADRQTEVPIGVAGDPLQASPASGCDVDVTAFVYELGEFRHRAHFPSLLGRDSSAARPRLAGRLYCSFRPMRLLPAMWFRAPRHFVRHPRCEARFDLASVGSTEGTSAATTDDSSACGARLGPILKKEVEP